MPTESWRVHQKRQAGKTGDRSDPRRDGFGSGFTPRSSDPIPPGQAGQGSGRETIGGGEIESPEASGNET